jgi:hypothetical protein
MKNKARKDLDRGERAAFAVAGVVAIIYGCGQILRGAPIYTNWQGLDVSGQLAILLGVLSLLVAIFHWGRIHFLWNTNKKKHRR